MKPTTLPQGLRTYLNHIEAAHEAAKPIRIVTYASLASRVRACVWVMIGGLFISGITAFPLQTELHWLAAHSTAWPTELHLWLVKVHHAVKVTNLNYPFISYGTDWLAFAHGMLAILFVGPLRNPVKNKWVIEFGMIACGLIFALAFIAGPIRQIPLFWTLVDCSFGAFGIIPLYVAYRAIIKMENINRAGL